ncbi:hypothetical protein RFI_33241, partial [Reticulomyxa filosa]
TIFVWGTFLGEFIMFWVVGLAYAYLDLYRPSLIAPFKVQQNYVLSREDFLIAVRVALRNQALVLVVIYFLWDIYPLLSPDGFNPKLPSFGQVIFSLAACLPFSEVLIKFFFFFFLISLSLKKKLQLTYERGPKRSFFFFFFFF